MSLVIVASQLLEKKRTNFGVFVDITQLEKNTMTREEKTRSVILRPTRQENMKLLALDTFFLGLFLLVVMSTTLETNDVVPEVSGLSRVSKELLTGHSHVPKELVAEANDPAQEMGDAGEGAGGATVELLSLRGERCRLTRRRRRGHRGDRRRRTPLPPYSCCLESFRRRVPRANACRPAPTPPPTCKKHGRRVLGGC